VFEPAQVTKPDEHDGERDVSIRSARVADPVEDVFELFEDKLRAVLPHARIETGVGHFSLGHIERQVTAHGDGDFFEAHTDAGDSSSDSGGRRLSFVYYFNDEPRTFEGGELRIYDQSVDGDGVPCAAETFHVVEPTNNSIVFFSPDEFHEVRPVRTRADAEDPGSTRFTFNGWFHDGDHVRTGPELAPDVRTALSQRYTPSFTNTGFERISTPPAIHLALRTMYDQRINEAQSEYVSDDDPYLPSAPDFVDIEDVKAAYHEELQGVHEEWCGVELEPTAAYGLRVYRRGQTLRWHTDVLPTHVISSIVHLAHDTDQPWPLRIADLGGTEHDVFLEEGEMLLYESARCPHSRPAPLDGTSYCSLFLHYQPVDWNITYWTLVDQARADGATDVLPKELWPPGA
jgi:hypothetical protein